MFIPPRINARSPLHQELIEKSNPWIFIFFRKFAATIQRPFGVRYNPYTQSVEVLSTAEKIAGLMSELRGDICIVHNALQKIHEQDESVNVDQLTQILNKGMTL